MPQEGIQIESKTERKSDASFIERRDRLFGQIIERRQHFSRDDTIRIVGRVFEHSTEDGIRLAEHFRFTPKDFREALLTTNFARKHRPVLKELVKLAASLPRESSESKPTHEAIGALQATVFLSEEGTITEALTPEIRSSLRTRDGQVDVRQPPYAQIDALYREAFMTRRPIDVQKKTKTLAPPSPGKIAAEKYLTHLEEVLERRLYTDPIKKLLHSYANDPAFHGPTITEEALRERLKAYRLNADDIIRQLQPARYFYYPQLDALKRPAVAQGLVREIRAELPEDVEIVLDSERDEYRIATKDTAEAQKKETAEQVALLEEAAVDSMGVMLQCGTVNPDAVARGLAGCGSADAWKLRRSLIGKASPEALLRGLAGLDSEEAWSLRDELEKQGVNPEFLIRSITAVDSPQAWERRRAWLQADTHLYALAESLAGLDSPDAWGMRKELEGKALPGRCLLLSIAGVDSLAAWRMREQEMEEGKYVNEVALSLTGLDSNQAWDMRYRLLDAGVDRADIAQSLAGIDSQEAWDLRLQLMREGISINAIALGQAGTGDRRSLGMNVHVGAMTAASRDHYAMSLSGNEATFIWRLRAEPFTKNFASRDERYRETQERLAAFYKESFEIMKRRCGSNSEEMLGGYHRLEYSRSLGDTERMHTEKSKA